MDHVGDGRYAPYLGPQAWHEAIFDCVRRFIGQAGKKDQFGLRSRGGIVAPDNLGIPVQPHHSRRLGHRDIGPGLGQNARNFRGELRVIGKDKIG